MLTANQIAAASFALRIGRTDEAVKRVDAAISQLLAERAQAQNVLRNLLDYTGGSDLTDAAHPIVKARKFLESLS